MAPMPPTDPRHSRLRQRLLVALAVVAAVALSATGAWLVTPQEHVARGCFWWTAKTVDSVVAGDRGCFRGYITRGAGLADTADQPAVILRLDLGSSRCRLAPGSASVVSGQAIFDDGQTLILVDRCG